jgi:hypothetical protein
MFSQISKIFTKKAFKNRAFELDFLRGTGVFFMIITHVNSVFFKGNWSILEFFTWWGATVCFTIFLFVSGAISSILIFKNKIKLKKALKRSVKIMLIYYLLSLLINSAVLLAYNINQEKGLIFDEIFNVNINLQSINSIDFAYVLGFISDVIFLVKVPAYIEFLLLFAMFAVFAGIFKNTIKNMIKHPFWLVSLSFFIMLVGQWGHYELMPQSQIGIRLKSLFFGHRDEHIFGMFTYLPVWSLGLVWGYWRNCFNRCKINKILNNLIIGICLAWVIMFVTQVSTWDRWPPSLFLFAYGFFWILLILRFYPLFKDVELLRNVFIFLGRFALEYYYFHVILLVNLTFVLLPGTLSSLMTFLLLFLVFFFSTLFTCLKARKKV